MSKRKGETYKEYSQRRQLNFFLKHGITEKKWKNRFRLERTCLYVNQSDRHKGGVGYEAMLYKNTHGLRGERCRVRAKHSGFWRKYKKIIAPESVIHHEWIPETANYTCVAIVEKRAHEQGIIKPILILDGKITLLTEREIKENGKRKG